MKHHRYVAVAALLLIVFLSMAACGPDVGFDDPTATYSPPTSTPPPSPTPAPTSTPTPVPPKELTICQAEEPNTLFIYGGPSRAARNVLEAIYDGPIDARNYQLQPVILEKLPSLADGDAALRTVEVQGGDRVWDINHHAVDLAPGVTILGADGQEVAFAEGDVLTTTQMVVTFTLRADVVWADGEPLTADDSRYAFELVSELEDPALRRRHDSTMNYEAMNERSVVWTGLPGYRDTFYVLNFYHPLPRHVLGGMTAEHLLDTEVAQRRPLGWGAFVVEEWVDGDHITLVRNARYFRASEGLPHLDRVTFRFIPDLQQALDALLSGECDLITESVLEGQTLDPLLEAAEAGSVQLVTSPSSEWEHLDFAINPAQWVQRPNSLADRQVRQAVAQCVDRERIAREAFPYGEADVAQSYVASEHPLYAGDQLYRWPHDLSTGQDLLEKAGWWDEDGDGVREAHGIPGIVDGTIFSVTLTTTAGDPARERVARILRENLSQCGIRLGVRTLPSETFFADGPDGPIFGRQFDLALFSWLNGLDAPCELYLSEEIPHEENWWATSNNPGYASDEYDAACQAALSVLPGMASYDGFHREAQRVFSRDLPVLPLYFVPKLVAARPEVSGVTLDPSEYIALWNIEAFDIVR